MNARNTKYRSYLLECYKHKYDFLTNKIKVSLIKCLNECRFGRKTKMSVEDVIHISLAEKSVSASETPQ